MTISFPARAYLSRAFGTPTDARKGRVELSFKRASAPAAGAVLFGASNLGFVAFGGSMAGGTPNALVISFNGVANLVSNQTFGAGVAHTLALWWDTTSAGPNVFATVDGVPLTWSAANYPALNATLGSLFTAASHNVGALPPYPTIDLLSEIGSFRYQDGMSAPGGALGNNGCNLLFASAATLGTDAGGGASWTINGSPAYTTTNLGLPRLGIVSDGQSNASGNGAAPMHTLRNPGKIRFIDYTNGAASFPTVEPFPNVEGGLGCYIAPLCDLLYETGKYSGIDLAIPAQGGSFASRHAVGGDLWPRIGQTCAAFSALGAKIDFVNWAQGETDGQYAVTSADYCASVQSVQSSYRSAFPNVKFLVNQETWIPNVPPVPNAANIRIGQIMATDSVMNLAGIDWDEIQQDPANRSSGAHLSYAGRLIAAQRSFDRMRSLL